MANMGADMEVDKVADTMANMEVQKVADTALWFGSWTNNLYQNSKINQLILKITSIFNQKKNSKFQNYC